MLVADPALEVSVIELTARGKGVAMKIERSNPLKGVSGVFVESLDDPAETPRPGDLAILETQATAQ